MSALCRLEAMRRTVVDDVDVRAEWDKGAIIRRVEPEWADAGRATAVNAPWTEANSSRHPARCNRPDMISCSVNAGTESLFGDRSAPVRRR